MAHRYALRPDQMGVKASTELLCKSVAVALEKAYPGWLWTLEADDTDTGGVLYIRSNRLHDEWGYVVLLKDVQDDPSLTWAVKAAGEILERFRVRPGPYRKDCLKDVPTDPRGRPMPDISDKERAKIVSQQRRALDDALQLGTAEVYTDDRKHAWLRVDYGS